MCAFLGGPNIEFALAEYFRFPFKIAYATRLYAKFTLVKLDTGQ